MRATRDALSQINGSKAASKRRGKSGQGAIYYEWSAWGASRSKKRAHEALCRPELASRDRGCFVCCTYPPTDSPSTEKHHGS
uniref:Hypothethical protein n=1 Tax=Ralstonia solanacearum PSI07 TaxID=859657 RepID=D8MYE1_RALSL|nr:hypothethical protein [Ralstonia solanacearum PSI07]